MLSLLLFGNGCHLKLCDFLVPMSKVTWSTNLLYTASTSAQKTSLAVLMTVSCQGPPSRTIILNQELQVVLVYKHVLNHLCEHLGKKFWHSFEQRWSLT